MAGKRQPTDLLIAKGKKHLTKSEIAERKSRELSNPKSDKRVRWPKWLPKDLRQEFNTICDQLLALNIFCDLDKDTLGRYLVAQSMYDLARKNALTYLSNGDLEAADAWSKIQDRYYKQAEKSASALGLNISARCSLVIPKADEDEDDDLAQLLALPPIKQA